MPGSDRAARTPTSIVCVYNDPEVLDQCLARSIRTGLASAPQTEFIAVDNRGNAFPSAGAALNHGARQAQNDVVAFVHQDVVLHSLVALEVAAGILVAESGIGIAGAVGIDSHQNIVGRIRDRVVLIGEAVTEPRDVDSLDEVLLLVRREHLLKEPLSEDPLLAWHAYGVEYCARERLAGRRAVALDIPLTHNSLTANLEALDLAHQRVGELYPDLVPLRTTCGTVWGGDPPSGLGRQLRRVRGARVWWGESLEARALARVAPTSPIVLADVRILIDETLARGDMTSLRVLDLDPGNGIPTSADGMSRYGRSVSVATVTPAAAREAVVQRDPKDLLLITAADARGIVALGPLGHIPHVIGHSRDTGVWVLVGVPAATLAPLWPGRRNRPFAGLTRLPRAPRTASRPVSGLSRLARVRARAVASGYGTLVTLTDLLPPRIRYGYVHRITAGVLRRPLPVLPSPATGISASVDGEDSGPGADLTCALAADGLDIGGIGFVIEMLAEGLPSAKVRPVIVCRGEGTRAARLRARGIDVRSVATSDEAASAFRDADVIALHSAPGYIEAAAIESGLPLVTAMHNTEIHFTRRRWTAFRELIRRSDAGVAVSETVREFHARHVPAVDARRFRVVPNGVPGSAPATDEERTAARDALADVLGVPLGDDVVFVCLARYDSQKNVAGTVASFLHGLEGGLAGVRFVYAGDPSDWAELRRADAIRRCSPHADRVHLLGNSHAQTLLRAADAFLLNSFFEGWAVAATEASATGLPLVLSEVGGGAELVSFDADRSVLVPNAVGEAAAVTDARVGAARRRSQRQPNRDALVQAVAVVAGRVRADPSRRVPPAILTGVSDMVQGHAAAIRSAGAPRTQQGIRPSRTPPP